MIFICPIQVFENVENFYLMSTYIKMTYNIYDIIRNLTFFITTLYIYIYIYIFINSINKILYFSTFI